MNEIFQKLPKDITNIILQYDGRIVCRNGRYVNRYSDTAFQLLYQVMKSDRCRRKHSQGLDIHNTIVNTEPNLHYKEYKYFLSNRGVSVYFYYTKGYSYNNELLYSNNTDCHR